MIRRWLFRSLFTLGTALAACQPRLDPLLTPVDAQVQVGYDDSLARYPLPLRDLDVLLQSAGDSTQVRTSRTDAQGVARFPALEAAVYHVLVQTTVSAAEYQSATGQSVPGPVRFTAELRQQVFTSATPLPIKLRVKR